MGYKAENPTAESMMLLQRMGELKRKFPVGTCVQYAKKVIFVIVNYFDHFTEGGTVEHCVGYTRRDGTRSFGPITMLANATLIEGASDEAWTREALAAQALRSRVTALLRQHREDLRITCRLPDLPTLSGHENEAIRRQFFSALADQFPKSYPAEAAPRNTTGLSPVPDDAIQSFLEQFFQTSEQKQGEPPKKEPPAEAPTREGYFLFQNPKEPLTVEIDGVENVLCTSLYVKQLLREANPGIIVTREQARVWANRHCGQSPFQCRVLTQATRANAAGAFPSLRTAAAYDVEAVRTALPLHSLYEEGILRLNEQGWMVLESGEGETEENTRVWSAGKWCTQNGLHTELFIKILGACGVKPIGKKAYDGPQSRQKVNLYHEEDLQLHRTLVLGQKGIEFRPGKEMADPPVRATTVRHMVMQINSSTGTPTKEGIQERRAFFGIGEQDTQEVDTIREGELQTAIKDLQIAPLALQNFLDAGTTLAAVERKGRNLVRAENGGRTFLLTVKKRNDILALTNPENTVMAYGTSPKEKNREVLYSFADMIRAAKKCLKKEE